MSKLRFNSDENWKLSVGYWVFKTFLSWAVIPGRHLVGLPPSLRSYAGQESLYSKWGEFSNAKLMKLINLELFAIFDSHRRAGFLTRQILTQGTEWKVHPPLNFHLYKITKQLPHFIHFLVVGFLLMLCSSCYNASGNVPTPTDAVKTGSEKTGDANSLPPLSVAEKRVLDKLGGELLPDQNIKIGDMTIHRRELEISFPGMLNMTEGDLEVLIALPHGRVHESLLVSEADPLELQLALLLFGAENGSREGGERIPQGTILNIDVKPKDGGRVPVENWLFNKRTSKGMDRFGWVFIGSSFTHDMHCLAKEEGNIVNVWSFGNTVLDNPASTGDEDDFIVVNPGTVPKRGTPVTIYLSFGKPGK